MTVQSLLEVVSDLEHLKVESTEQLWLRIRVGHTVKQSHGDGSSWSEGLLAVRICLFPSLLLLLGQL